MHVRDNYRLSLLHECVSVCVCLCKTSCVCQLPFDQNLLERGGCDVFAADSRNCWRTDAPANT